MATGTAKPLTLPSELADEQAVLHQRYADAAAAEEVPKLNHETIARVFAVSPFVAEVAIKRPAEFAQMVSATAIADAREVSNYQNQLDQALAASADSAAAKRALRRVRQIEMARIAWRDIALECSPEVIMGELSALADAVIISTIGWLGQHLTPRFGVAYDDHDRPLELMVIAMGKLGGGELNFSSDIDLIFAYGAGGTTRGGRKELAHQDYFDRLGREFIALVNETTADGFVFRVDMRLRPFGDSGPLTASLAALEDYYTAHGRDWERYALIKARCVSGDPASQDRLAAIIRPFVYRRYLDFGALDALREMKQLINREARTQELAGNIKRGPGGIREIEFIGQLFQLTRGGREPRLRVRAILPVLQVCEALGLLASDDVAALNAAYRFMRVTEHRLQQVHDWQTHALPEDETNRARLAYAMGATDWSAFMHRLDQHRNNTRALFDHLLEAPGDDDKSDHNNWAAVWNAAQSTETLDASVAEATISLSSDVRDLLIELNEPRFIGRLSREGRERLDRLMPSLLRELEQKPLRQTALKHLGQLLHNVARRSVYLAFLADNPDAINRLLMLFNASPWIAAQIIAHPLLLDELLDQRVLFSPPDRARLNHLIATSVRSQDGLEQAMENLRAFRNQQVLRVAASDVTEHFPVAEVSNQLTSIAEVCIDSALELAWSELCRRFGQPMCEDQGKRRKAGFAVIAYGKLGGYELGYGSDLDLVFLHDSRGREQHTDGEKSIENEVFFTRLVQRFIHILGTTTAAGSAYEVDTRLRPSGNAGMLVSSVSAYHEYLKQDAWVWEHQALIRARAAAGDPEVVAAFLKIREQVLATVRDQHELRDAVATMRDRMLGERDRSSATIFDLKHGRGGITDIEFMVQYAVLMGATAHPQLLAWTDNLRLLETLDALELMPSKVCAGLHDAYFAYRAEIHRCTLQEVPAQADIADFQEHRATVIEIWKSIFD